jgi:hypothetical protein
MSNTHNIDPVDIVSIMEAVWTASDEQLRDIFREVRHRLQEDYQLTPLEGEALTQIEASLRRQGANR